MADSPDFNQIIKRTYFSGRNALRVLTVAEAITGSKKQDSKQVLKQVFSNTTNALRAVSTN